MYVNKGMEYPAPLKNLNTMNMGAFTEPASKAPEINVMMADQAMAHFRPYLSAKKPIPNAATAPPTVV